MSPLSTSRRAVFLRLTVVSAAGLAALLVPGIARAADVQANPSNLASVFGAARAGDVIHLAGGSYGKFRGARKPGMVTLVADPGVTATISTQLTDAAFIRFQNLTVDTANLMRSQHIEYVGNRFTGTAYVSTVGYNGDSAILFDRNTHNGVAVCSSCAEGRITVHGDRSNTLPVGVTIQNSYFGGGGNSDGIQVGSRGVQILNNEIADLRQGDPSLAHTDALQLYGASYTTIRGNYIHDTASGIMSPDGANHELIEHNVIVRTGNAPVILGPDDGSTVRHNTFGGILRICTCNPGSPGRGTVVKDNIVQSLLVEGDSTLATEDNNLVGSGSSRGAHDVKGRPTFVGGASPTSWAAFALAATSPGKRAASDGTDIGVDVNVRTAPSAPGAVAPGAAVATPGAASGGPALALLRPRAGALFGKRMRVHAKAGHRSGIDRVELWIGHGLVARDSTAPFAWRLRFGRRHRAVYTLSVRAFAGNGGVSSAAVRIRRRHRSAHRSSSSRAPSSFRWRVRSSSGARGTLLRGRGAPRRRLVVRLASCADPSGRIVRRVQLKSGRRGRLRAHLGRRGLCVVGIVSRP
jgi:hypothetical protein